jgi:hypothetical protein
MVQWPGLLLGYRVNLSHNVIPRGHSTRRCALSAAAALACRGGLSEHRLPRCRGRRGAAQEKKADPRRARSRSAMAIRLLGETFTIRSGKVSRFHTRTGLRTCCRRCLATCLPRPWNCHLLMGRRTLIPQTRQVCGAARRPPPGCSGGFCPALRAAMTSAPEREISTSIFMTGLLLDRFSHESYGRLSSVHPSCDCEAGQPMPVINCEPGGRHFARHPVGAARRSTRAADDGCAHPSWRCMS